MIFHDSSWILMGKQQEFFVLPHRKGQGQGQLQGQQHERKPSHETRRCEVYLNSHAMDSCITSYYLHLGVYSCVYDIASVYEYVHL